MKIFLICFWGAWLGVALAGDITDWYWWINAVGLNLLGAYSWRIDYK